MMRIIFVMDPLESVKDEKDTSFAFMEAAHERGHRIIHVDRRDLEVVQGRVVFQGRELVPARGQSFPFRVQEWREWGEAEVDAIFVRTDPPFNEHYLEVTWLLSLLPARIVVVNSPAGLRTVNEKIWVNRFVEHTPRTVVTRFMDRYLEVLAREKTLIVKPINGHGGKGVFVVKHGESNARVIFESSSHGGSRNVILQQFIPEADMGDKRVLLLDGEPIGSVLRVHMDGEHRNNFFAGGSPEPCDITVGELAIIQAIKPELLRLGLFFVGLDFLGGRLVEVNVTSPTCLQEINNIHGLRLDIKVIEALENKVEALRKNG